MAATPPPELGGVNIYHHTARIQSDKRHLEDDIKLVNKFGRWRPFLLLLTAAVVVVLTFMLFSSVICLFIFDIITMSGSRIQTVFIGAERCTSCNVTIVKSHLLLFTVIGCSSPRYIHKYLKKTLNQINQ